MKMELAQLYRARAHAERASADQTFLLHERLRDLQSADVWDSMADRIEHANLLKKANDGAKRAEPVPSISSRSRVTRLAKTATDSFR
jgi:hypothetical protein